MRPLVLYFNELSAPPVDIPQELRALWGNWALMLYDSLHQASRHHPGLKITFPEGCWHSLHSAKPFSVWVREWLGRDQYRWFVSKLQKCCTQENLLSEVYFNNRRALGMTLSSLAHGWVFSFPLSDSPWLSFEISATEHRLEGLNISENACSIRQLSHKDHATHWQNELIGWGLEEALDNIVWELEDYVIEMYPLDHCPPHVHLVARGLYEAGGRSKTVAKFRVDRIQRMEGPPRWDGNMCGWIEKHKDQLLISWDHCMRGGHPYRIVGTE